MYADPSAAGARKSKERATISVENGIITARFYLSNPYTHIYIGTAEDAAAVTNEDGDDASAYVAGDPDAGYTPHFFALPISALNEPITIATFSGGYKGVEEGMWYTRQVVFSMSDDEYLAIVSGNASSDGPDSGQGGEGNAESSTPDYGFQSSSPPSPGIRGLDVAVSINTAKITADQVVAASELGVTSITIGKRVKKIAKGAFASTAIKKIVVKSKKLTKKSVKGCLANSKVKKVKVKVGGKKANKKFVKKYKKVFSKKNCGKKVKVG